MTGDILSELRKIRDLMQRIEQHLVKEEPKTAGVGARIWSCGHTHLTREAALNCLAKQRQDATIEDDGAD